MNNDNKPEENNDNTITLTYGKMVRIKMVEGEVMVSNMYSTNPAGIYVIGKWDEETLKKYNEKESGIPPFPDGVNKMNFIPYEQVLSITFDIDPINLPKKPQDKAAEG